MLSLGTKEMFLDLLICKNQLQCMFQIGLKTRVLLFQYNALPLGYGLEKLLFHHKTNFLSARGEPERF